MSVYALFYTSHNLICLGSCQLKSPGLFQCKFYLVFSHLVWYVMFGIYFLFPSFKEVFPSCYIRVEAGFLPATGNGQRWLRISGHLFCNRNSHRNEQRERAPLNLIFHFPARISNLSESNCNILCFYLVLITLHRLV